MKLSDRILGLTDGGPDGWDLFRRARAMAEAGEDVVELTIGEHDIRTDPAILDAMDAAARAGHTGYSAIRGTLALREAIAERTQRITGVATTADEVVVTAGGQAALFAAVAATCDPGETALYIDPFYVTYPGTIRGPGAQARAVPARADLGFQPDPADLDAAAPGARALIINSPNNPTGVVYDRKTMDGIAAVVRAHDLWVISDEVYDSQVWDGDHLSPRALPGMAEHTLVVGSLSKSHAMTGSRIGWIIAPEGVAAHLDDLSTHTTYGIPGFIQDAGLFALSQGADFEREIAAPFARRHRATAAIFARSTVIDVVPSRATMYLMLDVRRTGLSSEDFAWALLEDERIAVMPGESFGTAARGHVRVALTTSDDRLADAARRIHAFAKRQAERAA